MNPDDPQLSGLLRQARVAPDLPPRFAQQVWHRIEAAEAAAAPVSWLDALAGWVMRPRFAVAGIALLLLSGILAGTMSGREISRTDARQNYLAAVAPHSER
jgi:hypothetical protein